MFGIDYNVFFRLYYFSFRSIDHGVDEGDAAVPVPVSERRMTSCSGIAGVVVVGCEAAAAAAAAVAAAGGGGCVGGVEAAAEILRSAPDCLDRAP